MRKRRERRVSKNVFVNMKKENKKETRIKVKSMHINKRNENNMFMKKSAGRKREKRR